MSHLEVGNYFFHAVKRKADAKFSLKWGAFMIGNVLPDISRFAFIEHHYESTRGIYRCFLSKARNTENTDRERSMALGVICHFLCDYFCKYHGKKPYKEKPLILHICYEIMLHMRIMTVLLCEYTGMQGEVGKEIQAGSFELRSMLTAYEAEGESLVTDVEFAFAAVREVMKEVLAGEELSHKDSAIAGSIIA
jgi:hypothetical protein